MLLHLGSILRFVARYAALSRHGALATASRLQPPVGVRRPFGVVAGLLSGSLLIGTGVALFLQARLGVPPYDVLLSAVSRLTPLSHGQAAWAVSGVLLLIASALGRRPQPAGVVFMFANGLAVDAMSQVINEPASLAGRLGFVLIGTVSIAAGIAVVLHSGTTGGAFELLMSAGADRGLRPSTVRTGLEMGVLVGGGLLGGEFGPATLLFAATIAVAMRLWVQALADHRYGRQTRLVDTSPAGRWDGLP